MKYTASDSESDDNYTNTSSTTASGQSSLVFSPSRRQLSTKTEIILPDPSLQIAEVVFDVLKTEGLDLSTLPACEKSFALPVDPDSGVLFGVVGREPQADFFERVVPRRESLACISRSHFEVRLEPGADVPVLRKLSRNPMHINNIPAGSEEIALTDESVIGFKGTIDWAPCFLNLCVTFRSRGVVDLEGPHPSITAKMRRQESKNSMNSFGSKHSTRTFASGGHCKIAAVLECYQSEGTDLDSVSPDERVIPLCLHQSLEVGRSCQEELFETLLSNEKQTLWKMISRRHCRVQLGTGAPPSDIRGADQVDLQAREGRSLWMLVENLSCNSICVDGEIVGQGQSRIITEGANLVFMQRSQPEKASNFLSFRLRRARIVRSGRTFASTSPQGGS
mmetsp:Transcript_83635/g.132198  ORF Transcript_83635/g.132198 Transcript_83635/m.132198 type:complete len:393 (+) Transcript_83635:146-1324(+)